MNNCNEIKNRNIHINEKFEKIIKLMKEKGIKTFNENGEMNGDIKEILQLELEKCLKLYCFEYGFELPTERVSVYEAREEDGQINRNPVLEARGGMDGVKVYAGNQEFLKKILPSPNVGLTSEVQDDRKIHAIQVYGKDIVSTKMSGETYISSNRDLLDYFAELLRTGKIDLDFILDVFPHEVMHIFVPGQGVFVEGTTERLSRKASDKYGLRLSPTSHSKETAIISRLEAIVGEDAISSIALTNEQKELRKIDKDLVETLRFEVLKKAIDEKMGEGRFDGYKEELDRDYGKFLKNKKDFERYRNDFFSTTIQSLDGWMKENPDKLQISSNNKDLTDEQKLEIFEIQNKENHLLQILLDKVQQKSIEEDAEER